MRKSSSLQLHKVPLPEFDEFDPKAANVGSSRIDRLPLRPDSKRRSLNPLLDIAQLENIKKQNSLLKRQNELLRREVDKLVNKQTVSSTTKKLQYKQILKQRLSKNDQSISQPLSRVASKSKMSRVMTEAETGLFSSKEVSLQQSLTVAEWYDQYKLTKKYPGLADLQEATHKFCQDYIQNYTKLRCLVECLPTDRLTERYKKISVIVQLYKIPLEYHKTPQIALKQLSKANEANRSRQPKSREISASNKQASKSKDICWEMLTPTQAANKIESILIKMSRNDLIARALRNSQSFARTCKKIIK